MTIKRIDIWIFAVVLFFLIAVQVFNKVNANKDKLTSDPSTKLLTISNISQVCVQEPSDVMVCYDIQNVPYNILMRKNETGNSYQLLITDGKGH